MNPNMKQYRILHFMESDGLYGAENVVLNLSLEMSRQGRYKPIIGCIVENANDRNALYERAESLGIMAVPVEIGKYAMAFQLLKSVRQIKQYGIDVIHTHGHKGAIAGFVIHLLSGIPIVGTCHAWVDHPDCKMRYRVMSLSERFLYKYFLFCICVSDAILSKFSQKNVNTKNTLVIYNGIELNSNSNKTIDKDAIRKEIGIDNDYPIILNVGRLTAEKAQRDIISAAMILKEKGMPVNMVVAGEGILRQCLNEQIERLNLADVVKLIGFREDVSRLLGVSDIFLLPSLTEGLPIALLEAMSARVPVIATPVGQVPKIIQHGVSGLLVPVNDAGAIAGAVERYLKNLPEARRMRENAFEQLERAFSSSIMYAEYSKVYERVICPKSTG
jgi:glycosyltransferase involved in cell wall biosynthesis